MSWDVLFRIRGYLKGSLWFHPLFGAILGPFVALIVHQADTHVTLPAGWQYTPSTASTPPKRHHKHLLTRPGRRDQPGSRGPDVRHATPATAYMRITNTGVAAGTANAIAAGKHGCDAASRVSSLALTHSVHVAGAT